MITIGWILLGIGILIAVMTLIVDEFLETIGLDTLSVGSFVTTSGGSLLLLERMMENEMLIIILSLLVSTVLSLLVHFYITPLKKSEASMTSAMDSLEGAVGRVITTIPKGGVGEVLLETGLGKSNRPARCYENEDIESGSKIVVIEIKNNVFYVNKIENE